VFPNNDVSGEKDAVDGHGPPVYQSMTASGTEFRATIVAELQALRRELDEVKAR